MNIEPSKAVPRARQPVTPPPMLFHGTATQFLPAILTQGLLPGARAHVHLAQHPQTAAVVGQRYGSGVVLTIHALRMYDQGFEFYQEENGFWLTARVPAGFIR